MSLVSGPGRAGGGTAQGGELQLAVDAHVKYIQSLDEVCMIFNSKCGLDC